MSVRPLAELIEVRRPAWKSLSKVIKSAGRTVTVLPVEREQAARVLLRLQVTLGSTLGALAWHTGGVVGQRGWLRILGGGSGDLPSLAAANHLGLPSEDSTSPPLLEVARDVLGGRFVVNGGALPGALGDTCYFAPDTLTWQSLGLGHTAFVAWALSDAPADFYRSLRWQGWEEVVEAVPLGDALSIYPPLFSAESASGEVSRRRVPWDELAAFHGEMARQLAAIPEGTPFRLGSND